MPATISFPEIAESHIRATSEIIVSFFNGLVHEIGGSSITYPLLGQRALIQQMDSIERVSELTIGVLNATVTEQRHDKVLMNDGSAGYEMSCQMSREVAVVIPKAAADPDMNFRECVRIWDKLYAIFTCAKAMFASRGIYNVVFEAIPFQVAHPKLAIVTGNYTCLLKAKYKLN